MAVAAVAAVIALHEFYAMVRELRPLVLAGFVAVAAGLAAVHHGGVAWAAGPLVGMLVIIFWMSAVAEVRQPAVVQFAATVFGAVWIGLGFIFLVAVRDLPGEHGLGKDLLLAVVLGVWASDIAGFAIGRLFGRRLLAAEISPAKTVEGFVAGLVAGTATVFFTLYREPHGQPLSTLHALEFGLAIALAAPIGDLLESYLKRDMGVKDTGPSPGRARRHARPGRRAASRRARGVLPGARHRQGVDNRARPRTGPGPAIRTHGR